MSERRVARKVGPAVAVLAACLASALVPLAAEAGRVAVVKGSYRIVWDDASSEAKSQVVADAVATALKADLPDEVVVSPTTCGDRECVEKAARVAEAEEAIAVLVEENPGVYGFAVLYASGGSQSGEVAGSLTKMLEAVCAGIVEKRKPREARGAEGPTAPEAEASGGPGEEGRVRTKPVGKDERRRPLPAPVFWTGVGLTGALAVGLAVVEGLGASSRRELESGDFGDLAGWRDERDRYDDLRLSSRVFLGLVVAAAATTAVMAFFTDFGGEKSSAATVSKRGAGVHPPLTRRPNASLAPFAAIDGGGLVLRGEF